MSEAKNIKDSDIHPGYCTARDQCLWLTVTAAETCAIACDGCGFMGAIKGKKVVCCYHFSRFGWLGVTPNQEKIVVKIRPRTTGGPDDLWMGWRNTTSNYIWTAGYFVRLLKLQDLPRPETESDFKLLKSV